MRHLSSSDRLDSLLPVYGSGRRSCKNEKVIFKHTSHLLFISLTGGNSGVRLMDIPDMTLSSCSCWHFFVSLMWFWMIDHVPASNHITYFTFAYHSICIPAHWWWRVPPCWPSSPGRCWEMFKCQDNEHSMPSAQLEYITNLIPNSLHFFLLGSCSCMFILFILLPFASCYTFLISVAFGNYGL